MSTISPQGVEEEVFLSRGAVVVVEATRVDEVVVLGTMEVVGATVVVVAGTVVVVVAGTVVVEPLVVKVAISAVARGTSVVALTAPERTAGNPRVIATAAASAHAIGPPRRPFIDRSSRSRRPGRH
ncbi:MAG: hypothetical protein ACYCVN_05915 [Acidimicrobiales bacterium]